MNRLSFLLLTTLVLFSASCEDDDTQGTPLFDIRKISRLEVISEFSDSPLYSFEYFYNEESDLDSINFFIQEQLRSTYNFIYNSNFKIAQVELITYGFDGSRFLNTLYDYEYNNRESRPVRINVSSGSSPDQVSSYMDFTYDETDISRMDTYRIDFSTGVPNLIGSTGYTYFQERLQSINDLPTRTEDIINPLFDKDRVVAVELLDLDNIFAFNFLSPSFKFFVTRVDVDEDFIFTFTPSGSIGSMPETATDSIYTYAFKYVAE